MSEKQNDGSPVDVGEHFIHELRDRKPSPYPKLLMRLDQKRNVSLYSDSMTFDTYAEVYFRAAKRLPAEASAGAVRSRYMGLPILYLYRHSVELLLKACVDGLGMLVREHDSSEKFRFKEVHPLSTLLGDLRHRHDEAKSHTDNLKLPSKQAQDFIKELADFDDRSEKTRYPYSKGTNQPAIGEDLSFSLDVLDAGMLHVYKELKWYLDAVGIITGVCQDYKDNIRSYGE